MAKLLGPLMILGSGVLRTGTCMHFTGFQLVNRNIKKYALWFHHAWQCTDRQPN